MSYLKHRCDMGDSFVAYDLKRKQWILHQKIDDYDVDGNEWSYYIDIKIKYCPNCGIKLDEDTRELIRYREEEAVRAKRKPVEYEIEYEDDNTSLLSAKSIFLSYGVHILESHVGVINNLLVGIETKDSKVVKDEIYKACGLKMSLIDDIVYDTLNRINLLGGKKDESMGIIEERECR